MLQLILQERGQLYLSGLGLPAHVSTWSPLSGAHGSPTAAASPGCIWPRLQADGGWMAADGAPQQENTPPIMVHRKRNSNQLTFFGA